MNGNRLPDVADIRLETLLPHRAPMILIDRVLAYDVQAKRADVEVTIGPGQVFFDGTGVPAHVAIEYMAQAAAALVGLNDLASGTEPRPGLLLGTRKLELNLDHFADGETYRITAHCEFEDAEAAAFACAIADAAGKTVATATLSAYRPPDMAAFLKEQTQS